jgi:hypothetical protein
MIVLLFVTLALHCMGYNHVVDTLLAGVALAYLGIDVVLKQQKK